MKLLDTIRVVNTLGEGVLWHHLSNTLWWTDIKLRQLFRYDWQLKTLQRYTTPERLGSFGFIENSHKLIAAFESGIAIYDPELRSVDWLARPEVHEARTRFNDGRVDRQGRFWTGTMVEGPHHDVSANLYCVTSAGEVHHRECDVRISNGLCFSPDGKHVYFADSPRGCIHRYKLSEPHGELQDKQLLTRVPAGAEPDGANIDAEGFIWSAHWGSGQVVRYAPDGSVDRVLNVPASQPTCVTFGGPDLDRLFVTSARDGLSPVELTAQPDAGSVFVYDVGIKGLPEPQYRYNPRAPSPA